MSFTINQNLCVACGACFGNCTNRAIIRRGDVYFVTEMCSDCGACVSNCPVGAIRKGEIKAELDNKKLDKALKEKLSLKRNIVAMKFADRAPEDVPVEEGPHFWCAICGDIFQGNGSPVFFTSKASTCGGSTMIGIGSNKASKEEFDTVINSIVIGEGKLYATRDLMSKGRDSYPLFPNTYGGVVLGSLEHVSMPDLILFPINAHQMCVVSTAYAFDTGEIINGYAGSPTCLMTVPIPFLRNKPVFTTGDWGGRTRSRMEDDEILASFPYRLVPGLVKNLDRTIYAQEQE